MLIGSPLAAASAGSSNPVAGSDLSPPSFGLLIEAFELARSGVLVPSVMACCSDLMCLRGSK